ncbi:hypothetical protein V6N13_043030 [Hibiscus sabdariffa]
MEQNPSMDIEQVETHACSDRHAHNALLNRASDAEVIEYNGTLRKIRSVSNVVLSFMKSEGRIEAEQKLKKKGRGRPRNNQKGQGVANGSLSDSDFKNQKKGYLERSKRNNCLGQTHWGLYNG